MIDLDPEISIKSDQSSDAEQVSVLVEDQVKVNELLISTEETLAKIEAVGTGGSVISTETESDAVPPSPVQEIL